MIGLYFYGKQMCSFVRKS